MNKITDFTKTHSAKLTIVLAVIGIGIMVYYGTCTTNCSALKGDIFGIDLRWIGIAYMLAVIALTACRETEYARTLLAIGLGVEVYLYLFQIRHGVYCPFCLAFSIMLILAFLVNYRIPSVWVSSPRKMWLYFLGEAEYPKFGILRAPLLVASILGYLFVSITFNGSVNAVFQISLINF
jgi:hypothetical protein